MPATHVETAPTVKVVTAPITIHRNRLYEDSSAMPYRLRWTQTGALYRPQKYPQADARVANGLGLGEGQKQWLKIQ
jgi:hypothetical protein